MPDLAGTRLGPYEMLARIGAGGMGEVWKARDTRLDRTVAIKLWSKRQPFMTSANELLHAHFSPDGHFVAYTSDESGRYQVYCQTFPLSDRKWLVSTNGGYEPRWRGDSHEIYYLSDDRNMMAVTVGPGPSFGVPKALFHTDVLRGVQPYRTHYDVTRNGERFLINTQIGDPVPNPITVVLNWTAGLKK